VTTFYSDIWYAQDGKGYGLVPVHMSIYPSVTRRQLRIIVLDTRPTVTPKTLAKFQCGRCNGKKKLQFLTDNLPYLGNGTREKHIIIVFMGCEHRRHTPVFRLYPVSDFEGVRPVGPYRTRCAHVKFSVHGADRIAKFHPHRCRVRLWASKLYF